MRKKQSIHIFLLLLLFGNTGCEKNEDQTSTSFDVYVAGSEKNASGVFIAKYWKNGTAVMLTDGTKPAIGMSVAVAGGNVYVGGSEYASATGPYIAKVWKNGIATNLSSGVNNSYLYGIAVSGNDVYACGFEGQSGSEKPRLWKNGVPINLTLGANEYGSATAIFLSGTDVYVGGYTVHLPVTAPGGPVAKYWKNGIPVNLTDGTKRAEVRSIFVSGNDVYVAGKEETIPGSSNFYPMYWHNGTPNILPVNPSPEAVANSIVVVNGNIYVGGGIQTSAKLWINGVVTNVTNNSWASFVTAVFVEDNDVFAAVYENSMAKVWANNQLTRLTDSTYVAFATSIFVVQQQD